MKKVLQSNLRLEPVSGGTNFENVSARRHLWWRPRGFDVCTGLPKKLWIRTLSKCWLGCYITKSSLSCQNILSLDLGKKMSIHKKSDVINLCIFPRNRNQSIIYTTNQVSGFDMIETYGLNQISNI